MKKFKSIFKCPSIALIGTTRNNCWVTEKSFLKSEHTAFCIMNICSMNMNTQKIAHSIGNYVPLSSLCFFRSRSLDCHLRMSFLRIVSLLMHMSGFHFFPFGYGLFSPTYAVPYLMYHSFGHDNKTLKLLSILENQSADFSIGSLSLPSIILRSPSPFFILAFVSCRKIFFYQFPLCVR